MIILKFLAVTIAFYSFVIFAWMDHLTIWQLISIFIAWELLAWSRYQQAIQTDVIKGLLKLIGSDVFRTSYKVGDIGLDTAELIRVSRKGQHKKTEQAVAAEPTDGVDLTEEFALSDND